MWRICWNAHFTFPWEAFQNPAGIIYWVWRFLCTSFRIWRLRSHHFNPNFIFKKQKCELIYYFVPEKSSRLVHWVIKAAPTRYQHWMSREKYKPCASVNSLAMANSWSNNSVRLFTAHGTAIAVNDSFPERTLQASRHIICTSEMKFSPRSLRWFCIHVKAILEATSAAAHNFFH